MDAGRACVERVRGVAGAIEQARAASGRQVNRRSGFYLRQTIVELYADNIGVASCDGTCRAPGMMAKILIVEDDPGMITQMRDWLTMHGYLVDVATTGKDARHFFLSSSFDLVVMDWSLPDDDGVELCRELRKDNHVPILMLTGRHRIVDKEAGFAAGIDDYLTKPFNIRELGMRIEALLRRPAAIQKPVLEGAGIKLNNDSHEVTYNDRPLLLHPKEYAILELLMLHPDKVFSADDIFKRIWPTQSEAGVNSVIVTIRRLRQKLGDETEESIIKTIRGFGYKFQAHKDD
jgi:DNA-binding response OmpR family regulator